MEIKVGKPKLDREGKINFAIEVAFDSLREQAAKQGLKVAPVHLMYLADEKITQQFKDACRAVIGCLESQSPIHG